MLLQKPLMKISSRPYSHEPPRRPSASLTCPSMSAQSTSTLEIAKRLTLPLAHVPNQCSAQDQVSGLLERLWERGTFVWAIVANDPGVLPMPTSCSSIEVFAKALTEGALCPIALNIFLENGCAIQLFCDVLVLYNKPPSMAHMHCNVWLFGCSKTNHSSCLE
jgi:hypothetical protein